MKNALILSGGGARAAYQVGVLTALNDILPKQASNPFPIICGTSAGATNALILASHAGSFTEAITDLDDIWRSLTIEQIFHAGWWGLSKGITRLLISLFNEGVGKEKPIALLDNAPLRILLQRKVDFPKIDLAIAQGDLEAVCVTAMGYSTGESVSFFQGKKELTPWRRHRRLGIPTQLGIQHLLASSAIPTIFPTEFINKEYFGDGSMRQLAPISPALHLGADHVFVIGVSSNRNPAYWGKYQIPVRHSPSMAQILGHMLNSAFIDSLEGDLEHLDRVNDLLNKIPQDEEISLRPVETLVISPSKELDKIAGRKVRYLPRSLRFFMRSTGATASGGGAAAASYLLFVKEFCDELIDLGYQDAMREKEAIQVFFNVD